MRLLVRIGKEYNKKSVCNDRKWSSSRAQWVEYLLDMHETLESITRPKPGVMVHNLNTNTLKLKRR